jgi:hypothetical protein
MIKFIIVLLASLFALTMICGFVPALSTSTFTVADHTIRWYWVAMTGLVFGGYKAIG